MVSTSDFKKGAKILVDGEPYSITDFQHVKPGKGNQFTRTKMKHLITQSNLERTFKSGEKFESPDVEYQEMNFLYSDDTGFNFMNPTTFEQLNMSSDVLGETALYLTENLEVKMVMYNGRAVAIEVPLTVQLKVQETEPGFKGNTVTGGSKPATMETGLKINVPLHIKIDDLLRVNTTTGEYVDRVKE